MSRLKTAQNEQDIQVVEVCDLIIALVESSFTNIHNPE
jgi:hypothetical protein